MTREFLRSGIALLLLLGWGTLAAQNRNTITLSGYVEDAQSGERLIGVNVYLPGTLYGTSTNTYGFYSLSLPPGRYPVQVSFMGYGVISDTLELSSSQQRDFRLQVSSEELEEIVVTAETPEVERVQMSQIQLTAKEIKSIPYFLGEVDIIRALQLLPGVQSGGEGTTGFYVRGGSPDQNLILLDGVPVYNASHLFGFFSVFNADAIKNVNLTKGGFPARFGGRLSSVLEIDMKEGNMREFHGEGAVGLIASKLTLEGPLVKDKASFMISGRRTYYDLMIRPFLPTGIDAGYYFADLNAKINYKLSRNDRLYLSYYNGIDKFFAREEYRDGFLGGNVEESFSSQMDWGNHTGALRWNHLFSDRLFSNLTATFTQYRFGVGAENSFNDGSVTESFGIEYFSLIRDFGLRYDFEYSLNRDHNLRFGANYTHHTFRPGAVQVQENFLNTNIDSLLELSERINAHDIFLYAEDEYLVNSRFKINYGLHYNAYATGEAFYHSLQPRFSGRYLVNSSWSLKGSYAYMQQFIHLLSNSGIGLPTDLWVSATERVRPQQSQQIALGSSHRLGKGDYELSFESYYKWMSNLIEYKEGASFLAQSDWQNNVETDGVGRAYGLEVLLRKKEGKTTGWIGYTLARTERQFSQLNFGEWFPYRYDRRHDLSIVLNHRFSERFELGATWVYGSGINFTAPVANLSLPSQGNSWGNNPFLGLGQFQAYTERNALRMPSYHRMDVSFSFHKETRWGRATWNLSLYNAYSRQNPFFLYINEDWMTGNRSVRQVALFPIIPSLSYIFKF